MRKGESGGCGRKGERSRVWSLVDSKGIGMESNIHMMCLVDIVR